MTSGDITWYYLILFDFWWPDTLFYFLIDCVITWHLAILPDYDISSYFMIFRDMLWYALLFSNIQWYFLICCDVSQYLMIFPDIPPYSLISYHIPWYPIIFPDILSYLRQLLYFLISCDGSRYPVIFPDDLMILVLSHSAAEPQQALWPNITLGEAECDIGQVTWAKISPISHKAQPNGIWGIFWQVWPAVTAQESKYHWYHTRRSQVWYKSDILWVCRVA